MEVICTSLVQTFHSRKFKKKQHSAIMSTSTYMCLLVDTIWCHLRCSSYCSSVLLINSGVSSNWFILFFDFFFVWNIFWMWNIRFFILKICEISNSTSISYLTCTTNIKMPTNTTCITISTSTPNLKATTYITPQIQTTMRIFWTIMILVLSSKQRTTDS